MKDKMTWTDVKLKYKEFHNIEEFTENMAIDVDFGYWLVNQYKEPSDKMSAEDFMEKVKNEKLFLYYSQKDVLILMEQYAEYKNQQP